MIGLVAFARTVQILAPLTLDHKLLLDKLGKLNVIGIEDQDGTAIGYAIYKTANLIATTRHFAEDLRGKGKPAYDIKDAVMILVTDGMQDPNPLDERNRYRWMDPEQAAAFAKEQNIHLYVVNVDPEFSKPEWEANRNQMKRAAEVTGGRFYPVNATSKLSEIYKEIDALTKSTLPVPAISAKQLKKAAPDLYDTVAISLADHGGDGCDGLGATPSNNMAAGGPMTSRDLHYAWPWAVNLALAAILFAVLLFAVYRYRQQVQQAYGFLIIPRSRIFYVLKSFFLIIAWLAATLALMQPLANGHYPEGKQPKPLELKLRRPAHEVILLVDASASMDVADMHNGQTRLQYLKQLADELVSDLDGEQISLYAFTSELSPLSPPTLDYLFVRLMLNQIKINQDGIAGTDYSTVFSELHQHLLESPVTTLKTIVLLTDGGDTAIETAGEGERQKLIGSLKALIIDDLQLNARLYTVGMGSLQGKKVPDVIYEGKPVIAKLNEALLKQMADEGHGKYLNANDYTAIDAAHILAEEINELSTGAQGQEISNSVVVGEESLVYDHYFQIPLAMAIAALILSMYIPDVRKAAGVLIGSLAAFLPLDADEIRPAEILFEASEYAKSIGALEALSSPKLKEWQGQVLFYDEGTINVAQGAWDNAVVAFTSISLTGDLSPVLLTNLKINWGIALLGKARDLEQLSPIPYEIIQALQSDAINDFQQAAQTEMPNKDSSHLLRLAFIEYAASIQKSNEAILTESTLQEGLPLLLLSLNNTVEEIHFLEGEWVDDKLKEQYLQLFKGQQKHWDTLWNTQLRKWEAAALESSQEKRGCPLVH